MYESLSFPTVATSTVRFEDFSVSVDPTFACVVVQHDCGYDVFRCDEETGVFVFVCSSVKEGAVDKLPEMKEIDAALWSLVPWLSEEVAAVKQAWIEFFDGVRQLPLLSNEEKRTLQDDRMRLVAGVRGADLQTKTVTAPPIAFVCG